MKFFDCIIQSNSPLLLTQILNEEDTSILSSVLPTINFHLTNAAELIDLCSTVGTGGG